MSRICSTSWISYALFYKKEVLALEFTYDDYKMLLNALKSGGYTPVGYDNWENCSRCVILRHDVDDSVEAAVRFAEIEQAMEVQSTYFILVSSRLYNVFSQKTKEGIKKIQSCGHEIGLHFDEMVYPEIIGNEKKIEEKIIWESGLLAQSAGCSITKVSMHRPSRKILESSMKIAGMINSYDKAFFNEFKYLSDSHHRWREPVMDIVQEQKYTHLHILTHPVGYSDHPTTTREYMLFRLKRAGVNLWDIINENFTALDEVVRREELE